MSKHDVLNHIDNLLERGCLHIGFWTFPCISITEVGDRLLQRLSNSIQESELIEKAERKQAVKEAERDRLFELKKMPYNEYLKTAEWKNKARIAKERVNNRCQLCNSPKNLNVHHNNNRNRGNELDSDLIVLCRNWVVALFNVVRNVI
jgi:hypothetical protein